MSQRPKYRVAAKSKSSGKFVNVFAFWENEKGISGQLEKEVVSMKLADGRILTNEHCYFNLQVEKNEHDQSAPAGQDEHNQDAGDDGKREVPF